MTCLEHFVANQHTLKNPNSVNYQYIQNTLTNESTQEKRHTSQQISMFPTVYYTNSDSAKKNPAVTQFNEPISVTHSCVCLSWKLCIYHCIPDQTRQQAPWYRQAGRQTHDLLIIAEMDEWRMISTVRMSSLSARLATDTWTI